MQYLVLVVLLVGGGAWVAQALRQTKAGTWARASSPARSRMALVGAIPLWLGVAAGVLLSGVFEPLEALVVMLLLYPLAVGGHWVTMAVGSRRRA